MLKNEPLIGRRPIKGDLCFLFNFVENGPLIGRRPIKRDFMFYIKFFFKLREILYFVFIFAEKWAEKIAKFQGSFQIFKIFVFEIKVQNLCLVLEKIGQFERKFSNFEKFTYFLKKINKFYRIFVNFFPKFESFFLNLKIYLNLLFSSKFYKN